MNFFSCHLVHALVRPTPTLHSISLSCPVRPPLKIKRGRDGRSHSSENPSYATAILGRGEEKTRPSVRPSPLFNTSVRHACYSSINAMLEMPFIVSSSGQSIPNAVRAQGQTSPYNSPYSTSPPSYAIGLRLPFDCRRKEHKTFTRS